MTTLLSLTPSPIAPVAKEISTRDFTHEVIQASMSQPVLVDFWAPWCAPCKQLKPVLEKVVAATAGKVRLVTMDIDQNPQIAARLGIQSVPAVYAFYQGQPVDGFLGALPEAQVKVFVDKMMALSRGSADEDAIARSLAEAAECLDLGDWDRANVLYDAILTQDADNIEAYAGIIKIALALGHREEAQAMLDEASADMQRSEALVKLKAQMAIEAQAQSVGADLATLGAGVEAAPDNHEARYNLALALHTAGKSEAAIDQLLESIRRDRQWNEEAAKKQILVIFEALGMMHEITIAGRRKLAALLFR